MGNGIGGLSLIITRLIPLVIPLVRSVPPYESHCSVAPELKMLLVVNTEQHLLRGSTRRYRSVHRSAHRFVQMSEVELLFSLQCLSYLRAFPFQEAFFCALFHVALSILAAALLGVSFLALHEGVALDGDAPPLPYHNHTDDTIRVLDYYDEFLSSSSSSSSSRQNSGQEEHLHRRSGEFWEEQCSSGILPSYRAIVRHRRDDHTGSSGISPFADKIFVKNRVSLNKGVPQTYFEGYISHMSLQEEELLELPTTRSRSRSPPRHGQDWSRLILYGQEAEATRLCTAAVAAATAVKGGAGETGEKEEEKEKHATYAYAMKATHTSGCVLLVAQGRIIGHKQCARRERSEFSYQIASIFAPILRFGLMRSTDWWLEENLQGREVTAEILSARYYAGWVGSTVVPGFFEGRTKGQRQRTTLSFNLLQERCENWVQQWYWSHHEWGIYGSLVPGVIVEELVLRDSSAPNYAISDEFKCFCFIKRLRAVADCPVGYIVQDRFDDILKTDTFFRKMEDEGDIQIQQIQQLHNVTFAGARSSPKNFSEDYVETVVRNGFHTCEEKMNQAFRIEKNFEFARVDLIIRHEENVSFLLGEFTIAPGGGGPTFTGEEPRDDQALLLDHVLGKAWCDR